LDRSRQPLLRTSFTRLPVKEWATFFFFSGLVSGCLAPLPPFPAQFFWSLKTGGEKNTAYLLRIPPDFFPTWGFYPVPGTRSGGFSAGTELVSSIEQAETVEGHVTLFL